MKQVAIRMDEETLRRLDGLMAFVRKLHHNSPTTRSDVIRAAIERGISELERQRGPEEPQV